MFVKASSTPSFERPYVQLAIFLWKARNMYYSIYHVVAPRVLHCSAFIIIYTDVNTPLNSIHVQVYSNYMYIVSFECTCIVLYVI